MSIVFRQLSIKHGRHYDFVYIALFTVPTVCDIIRGSKKGEKQMAVSPQKVKANRAWDKKNMCTLACRVRIKDADAFRAWAKSKGISVNSALLEYVRDKIKELPTETADEQEPNAE
jgi:hypothetical protein